MVDTNNITRIEYTILGTVLMEPEHTGEVVAALSPGHFGNLGTRGLFETISALHFRGDPVDPVTVVQEAGADYEVAVREALQYCTAVSNLPYYCEMLKDQGQLRRVQAEAMGLTTAETLQEAREGLDRLGIHALGTSFPVSKVDSMDLLYLLPFTEFYDVIGS